METQRPRCREYFYYIIKIPLRYDNFSLVNTSVTLWEVVLVLVPEISTFIGKLFFIYLYHIYYYVTSWLQVCTFYWIELYVCFWLDDCFWAIEWFCYVIKYYVTIFMIHFQYWLRLLLPRSCFRLNQFLLNCSSNDHMFGHIENVRQERSQRTKNPIIA